MDSKIGMKYDKFSNELRIAVAYDSLTHKMSYWNLVKKYEINYNSVRHITQIIKYKEGTDFKHIKMYCDLNSPILFNII